MSKINKKPAQADSKIIKNTELLPQVFNTEPNKKMLAASLDAMTSKGQLLPFTETHGLRNASAPVNSFSKAEPDAVRRESDSNIALVSKTDSGEFISKVSYLDIENYFNIKGLPLKDGVHLDSDIQFLDLPINIRRFTDYQMFYWIEGDLPAIRIHADASESGQQKYSITTDIIGKPYIDLVDDVTGKTVTLRNGMLIYFTGELDTVYLSDNPDVDGAAPPNTYMVLGVGSSITLRSLASEDRKIPMGYMKKRPWDKTNQFVDSPAVDWDSENWDGGSLVPMIPEYIVMDRLSRDNNHWSVLDRWQHISVLRTIADFFDIKIEMLANETNQAKRPIICFYRNAKLYNWPNRIVSEIKTILPGALGDYIGRVNLIDQYGYELQDEDRLVFEKTPGVYRVSNTATAARFDIVVGTQSTNNPQGLREQDGAIITASSDIKFYKVIFSDGFWKFAQNKTTFNQTPLFDFTLSNGTLLSDIENIVYQGAAILGFKDGPVFDPILNRHVEVSDIDFDVLSEDNSKTISPNQIKFFTDVDRVFLKSAEDIDVEVKGPYGYVLNNRATSFYVSRRGLDVTPQMQDLAYQSDTDTEWTANIIPAINGFQKLHIFADTVNELKMYFEVTGGRLIPFSTRRISSDSSEGFIPLVSGGDFQIICHDLPEIFTVYDVRTVDNISRPVDIDNLLITNNGVKNGVITINLQSTYDTGSEFRLNPIALDQTRLLWNYAGIYRPMVVRPLEKSRFVYGVYALDKTTPIFHDYDFTLDNITLPTGEVSYFKKVTGTTALRSRLKSGDKVCIETVLPFVLSKTAPASLTNNPLNAAVSDINYYALYQHSISVATTVPNSREFLDPSSKTYNTPFLMGSGTIAKHGNPLTKAAIMATSLPFDFSEVVIKQGKHYDSFMTRLRSELNLIINKYDTDKYDSLQILSLAMESIYLNQKNNETFWYHSNMLGWGTDYAETTVKVDTDIYTALLGNLSAIPHRAGAETLLHVSSAGRLLVRDLDYWLMSDLYTSEYTSIRFSSSMQGKNVVIRQWASAFNSRIPASLVKIGITAPYMPEIYQDTSYAQPTYFVTRHDGTRYYLENGVDATGYPADTVDQLLYEFELAVWSSLSYDTMAQDHSKLLRRMPGGFRGTVNNWNEVKAISDTEMYAWMQENNLYLLENKTYDDANPFTFKYQLGSGDDGTSISGSWRAIYRYFYDTDRPHTHPWEMMGYTIKPAWWDQYYSWTDANKRAALEKALRTGNRAEPPLTDCRTEFVRVRDLQNPERFPVGVNGELLSPDTLDWVYLNTSAEFSSVWKPGDYSPYEQVFLASQRGVAAVTKANYLTDPVMFVNSYWVSNGVKTTEWNHRLDRDTDFWITPNISHSYHRQQNIDGTVNFTSGIESLLSEFCVLNNRDFKAEVVGLFANVDVNKEFLLSGFTNKNNVRIQNTSASNQSKSLFVPEENYAVRTLRHYPEREEFYSAMRIVWTGDAWSVFGFTNEQTFFNYYLPEPNSAVSAKVIGDTTVKEKITYSKNIATLRYGEEITSRQELYDIIVGYGKYLADRGFVFEEVELGDVRNWQLSAKQFVFWSGDNLQQGNYIDLNPASDGLVIYITGAQLENLTGSNENLGQVVDRSGQPIFSKDLLVTRDKFLSVKTKNTDNPIYGIKFVFVTYETVLHLESSSIFNDVFFQPELGTTKRGFILGGKRSQDWSGAYQIPGYMFSGTDIIPNYDTMSDLGRGLLDVEKTIADDVLVDAVNSQFGLNRNPELRQLFLQQDREILFKNAITFNKGTKKVFNSLDPLTHKDQSTSTSAFEEYMVRIGEFGNTKNIEYYEFVLKADDIVKNNQVISFVAVPDEDKNTTYITDSDRNRWVHRPWNGNENKVKQLRFDVTETYAKIADESPLLRGDTDYIVNSIADIPALYKEFEPLWSVPAYDASRNYKKYEKVRRAGKVYQAQTTISPNTWAENQDKFTQIPEAYLPNIFVEKFVAQPEAYLPDMLVEQFVAQPESSRPGIVNGSWQVLQTIDSDLQIIECCPGFDDVSKARVSTNAAHNLKKGDIVLTVNANTTSANADGIWIVSELETVESINSERKRLGQQILSDADAKLEAEKRFYIDTSIVEPIRSGKVFALLPVRFSDSDAAATILQNPVYDLRPKFSVPDVILQPTPSGFNPVNPIIIIDNNGFFVYEVTTEARLVKKQTPSVNSDDIEHLLIYDYASNKTLAKIELFDPKKLRIPQVFLDEIDTVSRVDPAKYNRTTDEFKAAYISSGWYGEFVGRRWWDTSGLQFADYGNGTDQERAVNWGATMNNTAPAIYEWTKSPVPPNQWQTLVKSKGMAFGIRATGESYADVILGTEQYHWVEEQETVQGKQYTVYYFWVRNKDSIAKESKASRIYSTAQLSKLVLNPSAAGFSWWAPISVDSIVIKGVEHLLNNSSTVVQIKKKLKGNEKHQQWIFVSENNRIQTIPEWMHIRFRDSISAVIKYKRSDTETDYGDYYISRNVPDIDNLHPYAQAGNSVRPFIQSWFLNISETRRTLFKFVNKQLINVDLVFGVPDWGQRLNQPAYVLNGSTVDMTKTWKYVDYYSTDYDFTRSVSYIVDSRRQLQEVSAQVGEYVKVLDQLSGTDTVYEITTAGGFKVVYRKNGTIEFLSDLWAKPSAGGWDIISWDSKSWDYDLNTQVGIIIEALRNDIYIKEYNVYYGDMICAMLRYILSEQINVDWIQKSSTIEPLNLIGQTFDRPAEFERDNVSILTEFYKTVKSYRDKIRDSNINKEILEPVELALTDNHVLTTTMNYNRVSFGQPIGSPDTRVTGLNFVPVGWDSMLYDGPSTYPVVDDLISEEAGWDAFDKQSQFDRHIQKIYSGVPATSIQKILSGTRGNIYYPIPRSIDGEFMKLKITEVDANGSATGITVTNTPATGKWPEGTYTVTTEDMIYTILVDAAGKASVQILNGGGSVEKLIQINEVNGSNRESRMIPVQRGIIHKVGEAWFVGDNETADMRISDGLIIDTTMLDILDETVPNKNKIVRQHYYNNTVAAFILREDTTLVYEVLDTTTHIDLADVSKAPDATAENPGFMWVGNELIVYFVKTDTGVTGLIRGASNTQIGGAHTHKEEAVVSFMSAENILYGYTHIQNLRNNQFFNDANGVTLANSVNPLAMRIKN